MNRVRLLPHLLRGFARPLVLCGFFASLLTSAAVAKPITYTGFTITDGKLGNRSFHNARVYLTMQSDTSTVQLFQPLVDPNDPTLGTVDTYINTVGTASVTVISGRRVMHATFAPNQILVSMDLGRSANAPHIGARGFGFSSFTATGIEPSYPLGIEDGTLDWGDIVDDGNVASAALHALPVNLVSNTTFNGRAWPCSGFPTNGRPCLPPAALHTDKGDFYLYLSYETVDPTTRPYYYNPLSAGYFSATLGDFSTTLDDDSIQAPSLPPALNPSASKPISYHGYTVADVTLGEHHYKGAQVYISVDADAASATTFTNGASHGFMNTSGSAHLTVISGSRSISADFDPGQIYVYFDVGTASVGFGSWAGRSGYPLSITGTADPEGLVESSSVAAVADIMTTPGHVQFYTVPTAALATDLTNPTTLSGGASSCIAFDPVSSICSNPTPIPLKTSRGDFSISDPYTANRGAGPYSVSWGMFWSELGSRHRD